MMWHSDIIHTTFTHGIVPQCSMVQVITVSAGNQFTWLEINCAAKYELWVKINLNDRTHLENILPY